MKKILIIIATVFLSVGMINAQKFDRDAMPKAGATPKINVKKPESFVLNNGLTVMVVENHKLPKVNISLSADQAPFYDGEIVGVNDILSEQLGNGTKNMSKDEFNKRIDFLGARLSVYSSGASANTLSKYFDEVMAMMADAVLNPIFDDKEVEKAKEQMLQGLKMGEKSADAIAGNVYASLLFGKNTAQGEFANQESVKKITTKDVENRFKKSFSPENFYLVIVGDVTVPQVKKALENGLAKWKKGQKNENKEIDHLSKNLTQTEINIVDVPSAVQSIIKVGNLHNLKRKDKDFFAARIANYILGGGSLESRLNMNLREKNAYTYGAYSSIRTGKYAKNFGISTKVRNAVVPGAVKEIMKEMKNIPTISEEDLKNAKSQLKGSYIMGLENPAMTAQDAIDQRVYELPDDFSKNYLKSIDAVTLEDVKKAAEKYILPSKARIFIVGKSAEFLPELEKLGYPISFYDKNGNPTAKPEQKKVDANVTVASIAQKYIDAIGGKTAVEKVTSVKTVATAKVQGMEMQMTNIVANGGKMAMDMSMMGQSMQKMVFNGKEGYIVARGQKMPMPAEMVKKFQENQLIFPELGFATAKDLKLKGIETIKDEDAYAVAQGNTVYYYSVKTGLKIAQVQTENANGKEMVVPTYYSNYKLVEGVKVPYTTTQEMMGQEIIFNTNTCEFNIAKDEDFK